MPYNIGVTNLSRTWCSISLWSDLPMLVARTSRCGWAISKQFAATKCAVTEYLGSPTFVLVLSLFHMHASRASWLCVHAKRQGKVVECVWSIGKVEPIYATYLTNPQEALTGSHGGWQAGSTITATFYNMVWTNDRGEPAVSYR